MKWWWSAMLLEIFANNVKYYRFNYKRNDSLKIGLSQQELSELCDLSTRYISDIERAKYSPPIPTIEVIAKSLKVEPNLLFIKNQKALDLPDTVELYRIEKYGKNHY